MPRATGAYNQVLGGGAGAYWKRNGWSIGAAYVAGDADQGDSATGGIANGNSAASSTVQVAYTGRNWNLTGAYNYSNYGVSNAGTSFQTSPPFLYHQNIQNIFYFYSLIRIDKFD